MSGDEKLVGVPVHADVLARALGRHPDFRVSRRMGTLDRSAPNSRREGTTVGIALDVETTGLDQSTCRIIELALQRFRFDALGRIVETGQPRSWLEDPGQPLTARVRELTGLSDADLKGRSISHGEAACMIETSDVVVAHNAGFDRPFVERRLDLSGGRWICSMKDIDWRSLGFEGRSLSHLLTQCGWFYEAHRASTDVTALLHLLDHRLDDGGTVLRQLVRTASQSTYLVEAVDAPFAAKDVLREREYRWNAARRCWEREVRRDALDDEIEWATLHVYGGTRPPLFREITWQHRYSAGR